MDLNTIPLIWDDAEDIGIQNIPTGVLQPGLPANKKFPFYSGSESPLPSESVPAGAVLKQSGKEQIFVKDTSYTIWVEIFENGSSVLEAYEKKQVNPRDIYFFCESTDTGKSNLFGTFVLVKLGDEYRTLLFDLKQRKKQVASRRTGKIEATLIDSFDAEARDNHAIISGKYRVNITKDQVASAMEGELFATDGNLKKLNEIYGWYNDGITSVADTINSWMENAKFKSTDYQPSKENPGISPKIENLFDATLTGLEYLMPSAVQKFVSDSFHTAFNSIKHLTEKALPQSWVDFLEKAYRMAQSAFGFAKDLFMSLPDVIGEAFLLLRAVVMGFVNGLISTLQMLISLCAWILKTHANDTVNGQTWRTINSYLEFIEDTYDLIAGQVTSFYEAVKSLVLDLSIEKLQSFFSAFAAKLKGYNQYDYAYFAGSFIFEVVLSIVLAFFTGGATAIAEAANMAEKFTAFLKLVAREAFSTATGGIIDILQLVGNLVRQFFIACKKGWVGLKSFMKNLFSKTSKDLSGEDILHEKVDDLENLVSRVVNDGTPLSQIFYSEIIEALTGITEQSGKIADGLKNGIIRKKVLADEVFEFTYLQLGGKKPESVSAFALGGETYFRESTDPKVFLKEIVHEGTHVLDDARELGNSLRKMRFETKKLVVGGENVSKYINTLTRGQLIEFRARIFEREFELAIGMEPDFVTIEEMITFIKKNYK